MEKIVVLIGISCSIFLSASQELSRDLFAYNYHSAELQKTWRHDRIARPGYAAAIIGGSSFLAILYFLNNIKGSHDSMSWLAEFSGIIGACAFLSSWISLMVFKLAVRLIIKNSSEESLKQTLSFISLRLKTAIADGQITLEDLECCGADADCPLVQELMQYARVFRSAKERTMFGCSDCFNVA